MSEFASRRQILNACQTYGKLTPTKVRFTIDGTLGPLVILACVLVVLYPLFGN